VTAHRDAPALGASRGFRDRQTPVVRRTDDSGGDTFLNMSDFLPSEDHPVRPGDKGRGWSYWSRNKLEILAGYLPAFNRASKLKADERIYLDLMAGEPENFDRYTGESFDGSARLALRAEPGFTRLAFGEMPQKAVKLEADLRQHFPDAPFKVYPGDCNETIGQMLADLDEVSWAPTFAFLDQQAREIHWGTIRAISEFRRGKTKAEQWILCSPAMVIKGASERGTNSEKFAEEVDRFYGTPDWRLIHEARKVNLITPEGFRREMVNLLRWRLETVLGYAHTARIPMRMLNGVEIYDMVFATDHSVGLKIMSSLYQRAAEREPRMQEEAREAMRPPDKYSSDALFELEPAPKALPGWKSTPTWNPATNVWWT
jgi:three-Cys-motif partner protein